MHLLRLMPAQIPTDRNYIVDSIDPYYMYNYDMRSLADINNDLILLEWDIAVAEHDLHNFICHVRDSPNQVHVAPYVLYPESLDELMTPVWAHRHMIREMPLQLKWIEYGDSVCDIFSTGMIYIPLDILKRISDSDNLITWHNNINDSKLAFWHHHEIDKKVPVHWDVRPVHLHYNQKHFYDEQDIDHYEQ